MDGMTDVSAMSGATELWKHETATELLSVVEHDSNSQLMVTDDYGDSWWLDVEEVRSLRDALSEWLDRAVDVHEGQTS